MEILHQTLSKDGFTELLPIHEFGKLQRHTLLLTALSTSESKKRENIARRWRRSIVACSGCIQRFCGKRIRKFGLVHTSQWTAGVPFH
jgi:hypothetical protein